MALDLSSKGKQGPPKYSNIPGEWKLEFPEKGSSRNNPFGGCRRIEEAYERLTHLGQGTYGEVFKAVDKETKELVAIKKIKMENEKEGFPITAIREIKILSKLAACDNEISGQLLRNNIIRLREIVRSDSHEVNRGKGSVYMVFDFMEHDMAGLLDRANRTQAARQQRRRTDGLPPAPFALGQVKRYMKQLFLGLALLHTNRILHRDLKNANLLVNNKGELKIADFGLARSVLQQRTSPESDGLRTDAQATLGQKAHTMTNRVITLWYRPPELCLGANFYGEEVDMWSAGCIMVEMLTGRPLFPGVDEVSQVDLICKVLGRPTEESMPGCTKLAGYDWIRSKPKDSFPNTNQLRAKLDLMGVKDVGTVRLIEQLLSLDPSKRIKASEAAVLQWYDEDPPMCLPEAMPSYESSHELTMKKKRQAERSAYAVNEALDMRRQREGGGFGYRGMQGGYGHGVSAAPPAWAGERR